MCRGACCESITLCVDFGGGNEDLQRFVELRSTPIARGSGKFDRNFNVACSALIDGRCGIYPSRPKVCRDFVPGGPECLATAKARRTEAEFEAIRDPQDPHWDGRPGDIVLTAEQFAQALLTPVTTTTTTPIAPEVVS